MQAAFLSKSVFLAPDLLDGLIEFLEIGLQLDVVFANNYLAMRLNVLPESWI